MVGTSGSLSKRSVYNHYLNVTKQVTKKPLISPTFFGKLVKRAFPSIKCNRKGPRGHTKQVPSPPPPQLSPRLLHVRTITRNVPVTPQL
jgi:hypothetical protein